LLLLVPTADCIAALPLIGLSGSAPRLALLPRLKKTKKPNNAPRS
jgi:hypothetical protein